ncbi:MAG: Flp family type IVb pilin [Bacillota bacterium]|nr:Flp family type IVb pilin [Bacillota bacterium]
MKEMLTRLVNEEDGQGMVEYGVIIAGIAIAAIAILATFSGKIKTFFEGINFTSGT